MKLKLLDDYIYPGKVLDVGCGNGLYGLHLQGKGSDLLQIDLADRRDKRANQLQFCMMDAQNINFEDNAFDHVIAFDVMEHLDDDVKFLKNIRRICSSRLFLSVPNSDDEQVLKMGLTHIHHKDKTHRREYSKDQLVSLLTGCGFSVLCTRPNYNTKLPNFALAMMTSGIISKIAAKLLFAQSKALIKMGLFENRTIGDWYCVAQPAKI